MFKAGLYRIFCGVHRLGDSRVHTLGDTLAFVNPLDQLLLNLTTNLAACVCQCAKFDQFLPARSHFGSKRPENFVHIAKFPCAAFGPLFAFHCPLFFTRNNDLECKSSSFAAVDRRSVADKQLHLNGVIHSASVAQCQELSAKT